MTRGNITTKEWPRVVYKHTGYPEFQDAKKRVSTKETRTSKEMKE